MKKIMNLVLAAILICGASLFTSCTNDDNPVVDESSTLALIVKTGDLEYFQQIESAFRSACKENNVVAAYFATSEENAWQEQVAAVEKLRSLTGTKLKGIIYAPCKGPNGECADAEVDALASELGIPVVILDSRVNETSPLINCPFFGIDNAAAGRALAQQVTADKVASFAVINSPGVERANAFMELKPNTTITEIPENSSEQVQAAMGDNQTFVFLNGSALFPSYSLLKEAGKEVYTFDIYETFLDELIAGSSCLKGIMVQNTFLMTRKAVDAILSGATEGEMVPTFFMTKDNLNDPAVQPFLEFYNKQAPAVIENLAEKIIGKWMIADLDGKPALTNKKNVTTFVSDTKAIGSSSRETRSGNVWSDFEEFDVQIDGNKMYLTKLLEDGSTMIRTYLVHNINEYEMIFNLKKTFIREDGTGGPRAEDVRYVRINLDYKKNVLGLWECKGLKGGETFNDANARLEFFDDGTYNYWRKNEAGEWESVTSTREFQNYFVDGILLCTRWKNIGEDELREWWEIVTIKGEKMQWKALRANEDGTTFEQIMDWEKVE